MLPSKPPVSAPNGNVAFTFVTDDIASSLEQAKAAGASNVGIGAAPAPPRVTPMEVATHQASAYPAVLDELPAWHRTELYGNNHVEADHGRLQARLGPMRSLKQDLSASVVAAGHALVRNVPRGQYELAVEEPANRRLTAAFDELPMAI